MHRLLEPKQLKGIHDGLRNRADKLRFRVLAAKSNMPERIDGMQIRAAFLKDHPEYQDKCGWVDNCLQAKTPTESFTRTFEAWCDRIKSEYGTAA